MIIERKIMNESQPLSKETMIFIILQSIAALLFISSIALIFILNKAAFVIIPISIIILEFIVFFIGFKLFKMEEKRLIETNEKLLADGEELIFLSYKEYRELSRNGYLNKDGELISLNGEVEHIIDIREEN